MDEILTQKARTLEDEFFTKQDAILLEKLRELQRMEQTQKTLSEVSGITNASILKHLVELDVHADLLATLTLVPLVEVAWADGEVQEQERLVILAESTRMGMAAGSADYVLLDEWLKRRPPEKMLTAWILYIKGLREVLSPAETEEIKTTFLSRARKVADCTGSFLGLTSPVSRTEQAMLDKLESAFRA